MRLRIKNLLITFFLLASNTTFAIKGGGPRGRYHPSDDFLGLPPLGFAGKAFIVGIILLALGWIFSKVGGNQDRDSDSNIPGIFLALGFLCILPSLFWLQSIMAFLILIGFLLVGIIMLFSSIFKKK
jgi:hypothetical protein